MNCKHKQEKPHMYTSVKGFAWESLYEKKNIHQSVSQKIHSG